jgi:hypothetical protein
MKNLQRGGALDFQIALAQGKWMFAAKKRLYALLVEKQPSAENFQIFLSSSPWFR